MMICKLNKPLILRLVAVFCSLFAVTLVLRMLFSTNVYRCVTSDNMKYIREMGDVKARYNKLWEDYRSKTKHQVDANVDGDVLQDARPEVIMKRLKLERDLLSQQMNEMWEMVGRLQCERSGEVTSGDGGWCQTASGEDSGYHVTDSGLVRALSSLLKSKSVGSFGDGPGAYKREILKLGDVFLFDAYDGAPFSEETSSGRVQFLDLTIPQFKIPVYDFILSLEVAEHIPRLHEGTYLDNLSRHARIGIILSWATPGQGGLSHVNSRPFDYVVNRMKELGFVLDKPASIRLQDACTLDWLKRNVNVYVRGNYNTVPGKSNTLMEWFS